MVGPPSEKPNCDVGNDNSDRMAFLQNSVSHLRNGGDVPPLRFPNDAAALILLSGDRAPEVLLPAKPGRATRCAPEVHFPLTGFGTTFVLRSMFHVPRSRT